MSTSRWFKIDWWMPPLQNFIPYLLCCLINMEERVLQSQIGCHTFPCLYQPRPQSNWLIEKQEMTKGLGLFYVALLTVPLYTQLEQFIIVQVTLPTLSYQATTNFMLVLKRLHLNLLNICDFFDPLGCSWRPTYPTHNNIDYLQLENFKNNPHRDKNIVVRTVCGISKQTLSQIILQSFWSCIYTRLKQMPIKGLLEGQP